MADSKISDLTAYTTPLSADLLPIVDTANTTTKKITWSSILTALASATQVFTNKTISLTTNTLTATSAQLATAISDETGSGALVFANTPTLVTPALGAATGTSLALGGGTALSTTNQTGTGNLVLATSPALTTPNIGAATATSLTAATNTSINVISGTYNTIQTYTPTAAGTATLDLSKGDIHHITMPAGNITIAISNGTAGQCFIVRILQDGTGSRTVSWFITIKWAGGLTPILTTTASKADSFGFEVTGSSTYDGFIIGQSL